MLNHARPTKVDRKFTEASPHRDAGVVSPETHDRLLAESQARVEERFDATGMEYDGGLQHRLAVETIRTQQPDQEALTASAEQLMREEFSVNPDELRIEAKLVRHGSIGVPPPSYGRKREVDLEPQLEREVAKRRFVNALIQGGANAVQERFFLNDHLDADSRTTFQKMIAFGDMQYWMIDPREQTRQASSTFSVGGDSCLQFPQESDEPITVQAQAVSYPVLLHEVGKGALEALALHGLPENDELRQQVINHADGREFEQWDLRIGIALWRRFNAALQTEDLQIRNHIFRELVSLPADEFFQAVRELSAEGAEDTPGTTVFLDLCNKIRAEHDLPTTNSLSMISFAASPEPAAGELTSFEAVDDSAAENLLEPFDAGPNENLIDSTPAVEDLETAKCLKEQYKLNETHACYHTLKTIPIEEWHRRERAFEEFAARGEIERRDKRVFKKRGPSIVKALMVAEISQIQKMSVLASDLENEYNVVYQVLLPCIEAAQAQATPGIVREAASLLAQAVEKEIDPAAIFPNPIATTITKLGVSLEPGDVRAFGAEFLAVAHLNTTSYSKKGGARTTYLTEKLMNICGQEADIELIRELRKLILLDAEGNSDPWQTAFSLLSFKAACGREVFDSHAVAGLGVLARKAVKNGRPVHSIVGKDLQQAVRMMGPDGVSFCDRFFTAFPFASSGVLSYFDSDELRHLDLSIAAANPERIEARRQEFHNGKGSLEDPLDKLVLFSLIGIAENHKLGTRKVNGLLDTYSEKSMEPILRIPEDGAVFCAKTITNDADLRTDFNPDPGLTAAIHKRFLNRRDLAEEAIFEMLEVEPEEGMSRLADAFFERLTSLDPEYQIKLINAVTPLLPEICGCPKVTAPPEEMASRYRFLSDFKDGVLNHIFEVLLEKGVDLHAITEQEGAPGGKNRRKRTVETNPETRRARQKIHLFRLEYQIDGELKKYRKSGVGDEQEIAIAATKGMVDVLYGDLGDCCIIRNYGCELEREDFQPLRLFDPKTKEQLGVLYVTLGKIEGHDVLEIVGIELKKEFSRKINQNSFMRGLTKALGAIAKENEVDGVFTNCGRHGTWSDDGRISQQSETRDAIEAVAGKPFNVAKEEQVNFPAAFRSKVSWIAPLIVLSEELQRKIDSPEEEAAPQVEQIAAGEPPRREAPQAEQIAAGEQLMRENPRAMGGLAPERPRSWLNRLTLGLIGT